MIEKLKKEDLEITYIEFWGPWHKRKGRQFIGNDGGLLVGWSAKGIGFGELTIYFNKGEFYSSDELMGRGFVRLVLDKVADSVHLESDKENG